MKGEYFKKIKELLISKKEIILLVLIFLFAFFIRVYALGVPSLWVDEAISANTAKCILEKGMPIFDSGLNNGTYFLHYSMAFFMLFGQTEFFARFASVIFGLLTIFLAYKIGKEYSSSSGIISALFFAIFYLEVFFSRQSRYYQLLQLTFFACLYFLYKSKENPKYLPFSIISFFIALDTHLQALVLAPFIILHILYYTKKYWFLSIFPLIPLLKKFAGVVGVTNSTNVQELTTNYVQEATINYASKYLSYTYNIVYLSVLFVIGIIVGFLKKKRLTLLILVPSIVALLGIFTLKTFAFRYAYFFVFPFLLYAGVLFGWLYDKYGKMILIPLLLIILIPSNLFYPYTYVNVIEPIDTQFLDSSAPYTDYKQIPQEIKEDMKKKTLISYFSPDVEFYIKKPNLVVPFSMTGIGEDSISINVSTSSSENNERISIDRYSGARIIEKIPLEEYYLTADKFSVSKLKLEQRELLKSLIENCTVSYSSSDLQIFHCMKVFNEKSFFQ